MAEILDQNPEARNPDIAEELDITLSKVSTIRIQLNRTAKRTNEQMAELCDAYKEFHKSNPRAKTKIAAEALGVSTAMIVYVRRKLGLSPKRSAEARRRLKKHIHEILRARPDLSNRELAKLIQKPKTTVVTIRQELDSTRDPVEARDIMFVSVGQQVRQLILAEGHAMTDKVLAERVGVALCTLKRWLKKLGLPTGKERRYGPDERYFRKMWADGWSDPEIAKVMGCCYQRVQKWRYRNGLIANVIHHSLRKDTGCRRHTPTTLLDIIGSPMGSKRLDRVWAFAALGADRVWLRKRFPDVTRAEMKEVIDHLLAWRVPVNLKRVIRRKQLEDK